jgi:nucleoside-diphosphate-sugar epimerase
MKVLITGGTGTIGKQALLHCLLRPEIKSVVALSRRDLPTEILSNPKLKVIILKDFSQWPQDVLEEIKDADTMIWLGPNSSLDCWEYTIDIVQGSRDI